MSKIAALILGALALFFLAAPAAAQSGCVYIAPGAVLTAAQWNFCFQQKLDTTFTPGPFGVPNDLPIYNPAGNGLADSGVLLSPATGLTIFAAPAAIGTGTCLSSANACALPTACSFVKQIATFLGSPNVVVAAGTYTAADTNNEQCHVQGNAGGSSTLLTSITGNTINPANVVIAIQSGQNGFVVEDGGEAGIHGFTITNVNGGGTGIICRQNCIVDYSAIFWGAWGNSGSHVATFGNAAITNPGSETLLASTTFINHWIATQGAHVLPTGVTTLQSSVTWSGNFASASNASFDTSSGGWSFSGSGTGTAFNGSGPGYLNSGGTHCASLFPGSGCSITLGFQTSAGDGITGTGIGVAQQAPTITDPILTGQTFAGLPGSPTAGQTSYIVDGKASNCGDSACTTFGTTVTGGGGALNLFIWRNGTNWTLMGK